jgi:hypothetical protein
MCFMPHRLSWLLANSNHARCPLPLGLPMCREQGADVGGLLLGRTHRQLAFRRELHPVGKLVDPTA